MIKHEAYRSEFAIATSRERLIHILFAVVAGAGALLILLGDSESLRARWLAGAVVVMAVVPFIPSSRWRIVSSLVGVALVIGALVS